MTQALVPQAPRKAVAPKTYSELKRKIREALEQGQARARAAYGKKTVKRLARDLGITELGDRPLLIL